MRSSTYLKRTVYLSFYVFCCTIYVVPGIWLSTGGTWQLRIVYLCWKFALGYNYCMQSERAFPHTRAFSWSLSGDHVCYMAWARVDFPFSPQLSSKLCPIHAMKNKIQQKRFLFFWGSRSSHFQQWVDFSSWSGHIDVTYSLGLTRDFFWNSSVTMQNSTKNHR